MNTVEAKWILLREMARWRRRCYEEIVPLVGSQYHVEERGRSGANYQLEIELIWDQVPSGDIRVLGAIDDGGLRAWCPIATDILKSRP